MDALRDVAAAAGVGQVLSANPAVDAARVVALISLWDSRGKAILPPTSFLFILGLSP